jgi:uncharacterized membrane protein
LFEFLFKYPREDYVRSDIVLTAEWPTWVLTLLAVVAAALITYLLVRQYRRASVAQLLLVWILQLAMVGVVILILLQPALKTEQLKPGENTIALVVDRSESMAYGSPESRLDSAIAALDGVPGSASADLAAQRFAIAGDVTRTESFSDIAATGGATSLADSLIRIIENARAQSLAAVILASDGIDTSGGLSAEQLAEIAAFGIPVHTIGVGRDRMPEDLELVQVIAPGKALPNSTVSARLSIRHDRDGEARVRVYDGDKLLATESVNLPANVSTTTARVDIDLRDAGYHRLRFRVDGIDAEPESRNNERSVLIKVEEQQFDALYFEGEPRWEYKFMRRALDPQGDIRLASLLRVSTNKFYRQGLESPDELSDGFPASRDELFAYHALIIGSVEAALLSPEQLEMIRDFVSERGGSLLMLAGPDGLGNGGWGQSAIADLLPARLPESGTDSFTRRKSDVRLTIQGADAQILRLADTPDENRQAWRALPQVADYQTIGDLKPAAISLLEVVTDGGAQPLLVTQPFGRGHVYILATGGTWRWQMSMPLEDQSHETFWNQLLRALVASAPEGISLSADTGHGDSAVRLRAEFRDESFRPVDNIGVSAVVSHEGGESFTVDMSADPDNAGAFVADVPLRTSGSWFFEAIAKRDGEIAHVARTSVYSESGQAEYFNLRRNTGLLKRLSDATGGRYFEPNSLEALPDLLRYSTAGITEQIIRPVWDAPFVFLLLLALKFSEWLLRRRWRTI